jgi:hypothetical protein
MGILSTTTTFEKYELAKEEEEEEVEDSSVQDLEVTDSRMLSNEQLLWTSV